MVYGNNMNLRSFTLLVAYLSGVIQQKSNGDDERYDAMTVILLPTLKP
jgi:hypothetical protein